MDSLSLMVRECLRGSVDAHLALDREMRPRLIASLQNRGATPSMAEDIAADILGECSRPGESSLLNRFHGKHEFESWLLRVGINRLIDRQRRLALFQPDNLESMRDEPAEAYRAEPDTALRRLVRKALVEAFGSCDAEVRVLLWLVYGFKVKQCRLAVAWGWSESRLSRTLGSGSAAIRQRTLNLVHQIEPGLTLTWEDIVGVCEESREPLFAG